jgi:hypothetical protein
VFHDDRRRRTTDALTVSVSSRFVFTADAMIRVVQQVATNGFEKEQKRRRRRARDPFSSQSNKIIISLASYWYFDRSELHPDTK